MWNPAENAAFQDTTHPAANRKSAINTGACMEVVTEVLTMAAFFLDTITRSA
jgi:hypothetical protein